MCKVDMVLINSTLQENFVLCHVLKYRWKNRHSCQLYCIIVTFPFTDKYFTNSFTHFQLYFVNQ